MAVRLILDTDIGTDVDDAWALALCLASDDIDLAGVTLVHADLDTREKIALKMLALAGRADVPVYKGTSRPITQGAKVYWGGHEGAGTDFSDVEGLSAREGAVEFIVDAVERDPDGVVVCAVGPLTNVAEAIRRSPDAMRKVRGLAIMGSTFVGEGPEHAGREHNACVDPVATKIVLESGIPATVVGLNVTKKVSVRRDEVRSLRGSGLGDYLAAMTDQYYEMIGRNFTYMHDPLAVATVIDPELVTTRRMTASVRDDGSVAYAAGGPLDVAVDVDADAFEDLLIGRISSLMKKGD